MRVSRRRRFTRRLSRSDCSTITQNFIRGIAGRRFSPSVGGGGRWSHRAVPTSAPASRGLVPFSPAPRSELRGPSLEPRLEDPRNAKLELSFRAAPCDRRRPSNSRAAEVRCCASQSCCRARVGRRVSGRLNSSRTRTWSGWWCTRSTPELRREWQSSAAQEGGLASRRKTRNRRRATASFPRVASFPTCSRRRLARLSCLHLCPIPTSS